MSSACDNDNPWESPDGANLPDGNLDSLTSLNPSYCTAERPSLENGIIGTEEMHNSNDIESASEDADGEHFQEEEDDADILSYGVPSEVKVSFHENDNDELCHDSASDSEPSDVESDEERDPKKRALDILPLMTTRLTKIALRANAPRTHQPAVIRPLKCEPAAMPAPSAKSRNTSSSFPGTFHHQFNHSSMKRMTKVPTRKTWSRITHARPT